MSKEEVLKEIVLKAFYKGDEYTNLFLYLNLSPLTTLTRELPDNQPSLLASINNVSLRELKSIDFIFDDDALTSFIALRLKR